MSKLFKDLGLVVKDKSTAGSVPEIVAGIGLENFGNKEQAIGYDDKIKTKLGSNNIVGVGLEAATLVAPYAVDPDGRNSIYKTAPVAQDVIQATVARGHATASDAFSTGLEAFASAPIATSAEFVIGFNAIAADSIDPVAEAAYRTIIIDPTVGGIRITADITELYKDTKRTPNGKSAGKFKTPLYNVVNNPDLLEVERTRLYPVKRTSGSYANSGQLIHALKTAINVAGENFETAPLKIGEKIDLIQVGTRDSVLADSTLNENDQLDGNITLSKVYLKLTDTEYIPVDVSGFKGSILSETTTGATTGFTGTLEIEDLEIKATDAQFADGKTLNDILPTSAKGHSIFVSFTLNASGNIDMGDITVTASNVKVTKITSAGVAIATDALAYTETMTKIANAVVNGYDAPAYSYNANLRDKGITLTANEDVYNVKVQNKRPITHNKPANKAITQDQLPKFIERQAMAVKLERGITGINKLFADVNAIKTFHAKTGSDEIATGFVGIGGNYVYASYVEDTFDFNGINSIKDSEKNDDISGSFNLVVKAVISKILSESKIKSVHQSMYSGDMVFNVLTSNQALAFFEESIKITGVKVNFVGSDNPKMTNVAIVTPGHSTGVTEISPMEFGVCGYVPEIPYTVAQSNGENYESVLVSPRYEHYCLVPVVGKINLVNIDKIADKTYQATKSV